MFKTIQVIEKKLLTLEKDKEDQSKYYLNYSKAPVLDIKWENRGINFVKQAYTPKFSPLLNEDQEKTFCG